MLECKQAERAFPLSVSVKTELVYEFKILVYYVHLSNPGFQQTKGLLCWQIR